MSSKPHIILLCPGEMRATALACYGNPAVRTPAIDALAKRGIHFHNAFVNHTKCTPSRCSLLTGQYPHVGGHRTLDMPVRSHEVNLVRRLREHHGYRTTLFGKNHCVDAETMPLTFDHHGRAPNPNPDLEPDDDVGLPTGSYYVGEQAGTVDEHPDLVATTMAMDWLEEQLAEDPATPQFVWLNWNHPHCPYRVPPPFFGQTPRDQVSTPLPPITHHPPLSHRTLRSTYAVKGMDVEQWREVSATYLDMTAFIDHEVQRVAETLAALGITENTIVVLWSDHGDFAGDYGLPEKWDTCFSDNLLRVPLIIQAPGVDATEYEGLTETIDILPTVFDIAGLEPGGRISGVQGRSHRKAIAEQPDDPEAVRDVVFAEGGQEPELLERVTPVDARPRPCTAYLLKQQALVNEPQANLRSKAIRSTRWKYVVRHDGNEQLFDLEIDP